MAGLQRVRHFLNQTWSRRLVGAILTVSTSACSGGNGFAPTPFDAPDVDPQLTGGRTEDGRLLTAASDDGELQALKNRIDIKVPANLALAQSIQSLEMTTFDLRGRRTNGRAESLRFHLRLNGISQPYVFEERVRGQSGSLRIQSVRSRPEGYTLTAGCPDLECRKAIIILRKLDPGQAFGDGQTQAGIILRRREARVLARPTELPADADASLGRLRARFVSERTVPYETLEVAWGLSTFELKLDEADDSCVSGRLVQTNNGDESLKLGCAGRSNQSSSLNAWLVGNNNLGSLFIRLGDSKASLYLSALTSGDERGSIDDISGSPSEPAPSGAVPLPGPGGVRLPFDPSHPVTRRWESDRSRPEVGRAIDSWTGPNVERMRSFLARIQPNLPVMTGALKAQNVPTEMIAITLIESRFFIDPGYPIEVAGTSTATGPWQFVVGTARGLGLQVKPFITSGGRRAADPCDERALLAPSSAAAGRYLRSLLDSFPNDPRLAVMSYYWGEGNVDNAIDRLQRRGQRLEEIKGAGLDFWAVRRFNMAPQEATDYVIRFLSAQFVGRNPERYGVVPHDPAALDALAAARSTCR